MVDLLSLSRGRDAVLSLKYSLLGFQPHPSAPYAESALVGFSSVLFFSLSFAPQVVTERAFSLSCLSWNKSRPL